MLRKLAAKTRQLIRGKWKLTPSILPHYYFVTRGNECPLKTPLPYSKAVEYAAKLNTEDIEA